MAVPTSSPLRSSPTSGLRTPERGSASELTRAGIGLFAALALAVGLPVLVVSWSDNVATLANIILGLTIVMIAAARLTGVLVSRTPDIVRGLFYVFVYVFLGLAALAQIVKGTYPGDVRSFESATVTSGLVTVLIGIVGYELGWLLWARRTRSDPPDDPVATGRAGDTWFRFSPTRTVIVGVAGVLAVGSQVAAHGLGSFFVSRSQTSAILFGQGLDPATAPLYQLQNKALGVLTTALSQGLVFVALFVIVYCRRNSVWSRPSTLLAGAGWRLFIGVLVLANIVMNNPIGNSRVWFCLLFAAFASIYLPFRQPRGARLLIVFALLVLVFFFSVLDAFRFTGVRDDRLTGPAQSLVNDDTYGMFQMELTTLEYLSVEDHTGGRQLAGAAFVFVPRSLWPDKPIATGQVVDPRYLRSTTLWSELEVDFGPAGVAVGFLLYGAASAALSRRAAASRPGAFQAVLPVVAVFQVFVLRGSLLPAMGFVYQLLIIFLVVGLQPRKRTVPTPAAIREAS